MLTAEKEIYVIEQCRTLVVWIKPLLNLVGFLIYASLDRFSSSEVIINA